MSAGPALGALAGAGCWLVLAGLPRLRRPTLAERIAPYLRDTVPPSRLLGPGAGAPVLPVFARLAVPVLSGLGQRLDRTLGGAGSARRRLEALGNGGTLEAFRIEQVLVGGGGLAMGLLFTVLVTATGAGPPPAALLMLSLSCAVLGVVGRDRLLTRAVRQREERILTELPTVAELLALAVAAGEAPLAAFERVARGPGELPRELARVLDDVRAGAPFATALHDLGTRCQPAAVGRFIDAVTVALERGTPLAGVLRAQAADTRDAARRALLEAGGRKEIAMMVPVVFLILPVTVVFALFPGLSAFTVTTS